MTKIRHSPKKKNRKDLKNAIKILHEVKYNHHLSTINIQLVKSYNWLLNCSFIMNLKSLNTSSNMKVCVKTVGATKSARRTNGIIECSTNVTNEQLTQTCSVKSDEPPETLIWAEFKETL